MYKTKANLKWLERLMMDPTKHVIFHNKKFDLTAMLVEGFNIFNFKAITECTLRLAKLFNATWNSYKLKDLGARLLGVPTADKDEIEEWVKDRKRVNYYRREFSRKPNFSDAPASIIKKRAVWDVETTLMLYLKLRPAINKAAEKLYQTELELAYVCVDMESHGVPVDITRAKQLKSQAEKDMAIIMKDLRKLVGNLIVDKTKAGEQIKVPITAKEFNPGSSKHLAAAFKKVGIELEYKTDKGNWSFDEYSMIRYVSDPLVKVMRKASENGWQANQFYRRIKHAVKRYDLDIKELLPPLILKHQNLKKMISTYYNAIINKSLNKYTAPNGIEYGTLHCSFNPTTAVTGRFSATNPPLQTIPRNSGPRECFVPRKSRRNWYLDYDQVEMKIFVHFAKDEDMAREIENDIHAYVAGQVYKVAKSSVTKEQRKRGKGVGFGVLYGSGANTMAETMTKQGLKTTKKDAVYLVRNYHESFPSVRRTTRYFEAQLRKKGFLTNPFGRRYHIPVKFAYKALNYMCQGTSADIIKQAMVKLWKWLRKHKFKTKLIMTIHDEIVLECPRSEEKKVIPQALRIMEDLKNYFVPITASAEVVTERWSKKKDAVKDLNLAWAV